MPELPEVVVYVERLTAYLLGRTLERVRLRSSFALRTVEPSIFVLEGKRLETVRRLGKRVVLGFEADLFLVIHLMIAGRLKWRPAGAKLGGKIGLAALDFSPGTLLLTEAGSKKRASLHVVRGEAEVARFDPGGLEVLAADLATFGGTLRRENHTVKRALTDPRLFSGIGNAYSDEILHRAGLSPIKLTTRLSDGEVTRLFEATRSVLGEWTKRLRAEVADGFPEKVTAFKPGMAVHGRFGRACPDCGSTVQRIVYAENETNYCPRCQTEGRVLADRSLSRLLKQDWPRTVEELEDSR